eukprot:m.232302 g.232302  ORF g.232302 m.232302 type:complete len:467 (-) comp12338_c0_seq1:224-1624(-)
MATSTISVKCLVVDNNEGLQCLVHSWLSALSIPHLQVYNLEMAVFACQHYTFEVLFIDLELLSPSFASTIQSIRATPNNSATPIVGWTGQGPMQTHAANAVLATVLLKPFSKEQFLSTLETYSAANTAGPSSAVVPPPGTFPAIPAPPKNARVLVVEDCKGTQRIVTGLLRRLTDSVMQAFDGDEAVALCSQYYFDMIVMDIHMPTVNGIHATHLIRNSEGLNMYTPIIAFTSSGTLADYAQHGINDLLTKPFTTESLRDMFDKWTPYSKTDLFTDTIATTAALSAPPPYAAGPAPPLAAAPAPSVSPPVAPAPNPAAPAPRATSGPVTRRSAAEAPGLAALLSSAKAGQAASPVPPPTKKVVVKMERDSSDSESGEPITRKKRTNGVGHTMKEKLRRASIVSSCNSFRQLVPDAGDDDKANVFKKTVDYLTFLRSRIPEQQLAEIDADYKDSSRRKMRDPSKDLS